MVVTTLTCLGAALLMGPGWAKEKEPTLRELKQAVQERPNDPEAFYNLGLKCELSGRLKEAASAYKKAISLKPDHDQAYLALGRIQSLQGNYEAGIKTLTKALGLKRDFPEARTLLAQVYNDYGAALAKQELYGRATDAFQEAIRLDPNAKAAAAARNNLGLVYYNQGRLSDAMNQFKAVLKQDPNNVPATYNLGVSYLSAGDTHGAWAQYFNLRSLDPEAAGQLSYQIYTPQKKADYAPQPPIQGYQQLLNPAGSTTARSWDAGVAPKSSWNPGGTPKSSWNPGQTPRSSW